MKIPIAIIAACAGTFALAQTGLAQTAYAGASEPAVRLAQSGVNMGSGVDIGAFEMQRKKGKTNSSGKSGNQQQIFPHTSGNKNKGKEGLRDDDWSYGEPGRRWCKYNKWGYPSPPASCVGGCTTRPCPARIAPLYQ